MADFLVIGFRECKKDHIDEGIWSFLVCSSWLLCHRAERSNVGRPAQDIRDLSDNRVFQRRISVSCSMAISHSVSWIVDNSGLLMVSFRRKLLESCFRKLMSSMPPNRSGSLLPQNPTRVNYVNGWKGFAGVSFLVFSKIVFPLIKPAIVTACIFSFMWRWDDFLSALLYVSKYLVEGISTSGLKG